MNHSARTGLLIILWMCWCPILSSQQAPSFYTDPTTPIGTPSSLYGNENVSELSWTDNRFSQEAEAESIVSFDPSGSPVRKTKKMDYDHWNDSESEMWKFQVLPSGLIYPSYLAGRKEPRLGCVITNEEGYGGLWDIAMGGRVPLFRYGTTNAVLPEGWQLDLEGAALLRLDFERARELAGTDYRAGIPLTYGTKNWQFKFAYYHVSSHLGDNYLLADFRDKINYVRDELLFGVAWRPWLPVRIYGEIGWAFHTGDTTEPWEVQFGIEYSKPYEKARQRIGSPFTAVDVHLFEELDFGGYINVQAGWQWRGKINNLLRIGLEYFNGCDDEFQFHFTHQQKFGVGLWYDF